MGKLSLILGGVALGAVGYGLKKWYDKAKDENLSQNIKKPCCDSSNIQTSSETQKTEDKAK